LEGSAGLRTRPRRSSPGTGGLPSRQATSYVGGGAPAIQLRGPAHGPRPTPGPMGPEQFFVDAARGRFKGRAPGPGRTPPALGQGPRLPGLAGRSRGHRVAVDPATSRGRRGHETPAPGRLEGVTQADPKALAPGRQPGSPDHQAAPPTRRTPAHARLNGSGPPPPARPGSSTTGFARRVPGLPRPGPGGHQARRSKGGPDLGAGRRGGKGGRSRCAAGFGGPPVAGRDQAPGGGCCADGRWGEESSCWPAHLEGLVRVGTGSRGEPPEVDGRARRRTATHRRARRPPPAGPAPSMHQRLPGGAVPARSAPGGGRVHRTPFGRVRAGWRPVDGAGAGRGARVPWRGPAGPRPWATDPGSKEGVPRQGRPRIYNQGFRNGRARGQAGQARQGGRGNALATGLRARWGQGGKATRRWRNRGGSGPIGSAFHSETWFCPEQHPAPPVLSRAGPAGRPGPPGPTGKGSRHHTGRRFHLPGAPRDQPHGPGRNAGRGWRSAATGGRVLGVGWRISGGPAPGRSSRRGGQHGARTGRPQGAGQGQAG